MRPKVSFVILKGARRNIPHDEPLGQSETKTITLRIHSIQVIPSGLLMSYRISLSEGVASVVSSKQRSECGVLVIWTPVLWCTALQAGASLWALVRGRCPRLLFSSALQAPECLWGSGDMDTLQAEECLWFFMM